MKRGILFPAFLVLFTAFVMAGCATTQEEEDFSKGKKVKDPPVGCEDTPEGCYTPPVGCEDTSEGCEPPPPLRCEDTPEGCKPPPPPVGCEDTPEGCPPLIPITGRSVVELEDAFFDYNRHSIRSDARAVLMENARLLEENPELTITIEGHCDERGTTVYNQALGERRAKSAKNFLVDLGIDADRIETVSYGKEKQFCYDHNEFCWQENRRSHFVIK